MSTTTCKFERNKLDSVRFTMLYSILWLCYPVPVRYFEIIIGRTDNTKYRELNVAIHVIFKKKKELNKSVKKYLLYEILCKELASQSVSLTHSLTHSLTEWHGSRVRDSGRFSSTVCRITASQKSSKSI